jgi:NAD(P)H-hydrate epimerase
MTDNHRFTDSSPLYTAAQVRELDRLAIETAGIPGYRLMSHAGEACWQRLRSCWPAAHSLGVVCGTGNNGGDGYIVARLALEAGLDVRVLQLGDSDRISNDALQARTAFLDAGGRSLSFTPEAIPGMDIIIDAMLGTGLERPPAGEWEAAIVAINRSVVPVLAVDIPSGLQADTGHVPGVAIRAEQTVTFIGRKAGLYTGLGPDYAGAVSFADLGVPGSVYRPIEPCAQLLGRHPAAVFTGPRPRSAHKGQHGHVLVVGGDHGMAGAARLAGEAALRTGAGLVSLATRPEHAAVLAAACPELMCHGVATARELRTLIPQATVIVIGPGLGRNRWAQALFSTVLEVRQPLVIDADALNLLAGMPGDRDNQVLTPHPGEAGRLLGQTAATIQADRFAAAEAITGRYGGTTVLKGAGTLVHTAGQRPQVCVAGNPGMATAGMGDVLSGVIAGLLAQGMERPQAAVSGVCVHAIAGDRAALDGERGMLARDVIAQLRSLVNATGEAT